METEEERRIRRKMRIEEMRREKKRTELMRRWGIAAACAVVLAAGFGMGRAMLHPKDDKDTREGNGAGQILSLAEREEGGVAITGEDTGDRTENAGREQAESGEAKTEGTGSEAGENEGTAPGNSGITGPLVRGKGNSREDNVDFPGTEALPMSGPQGTDVQSGALAEKSPVFHANDGETTAEFDETIISEFGVLIDLEEGVVLAQRAAYERMNPASMTKILTLLVAAEHLTEADLDATVPITIDITDYCFVNECSITGYERDEEVPVRDLFYGTILPSGADSSLGLAVYVAGSQEAFVDLMNQKLEELGLSKTSHFTNCVGIYEADHYTTAYDMAVMMEAAIQNEMCREVFSTRIYTTSATEQHPEGIELSNWFVRRIEDKETNGIPVYGKTGFVDESGSCAVSFGTNENGRTYICVTANSGSKWWCINDHAKLYQELTKEP